MARYSGPTWFQLGDRDLATHLLRSKWLRDGYPYNYVTTELCRRLGIRCTVLPMSEQPLRTIVQTDQGELPFQEYFVKMQWQPVVKNIRFEGADTAQPSREVISAIRNADAIVFCPSNPLLSIDPILAMPSLRRVIAASRAPRVAVSPIVKGEALKGPAAKLMQELGLEVSPLGVARHLKEVLTGFVLDTLDEAQQDAITDLGLRTLVIDTIMKDINGRKRLAQAVLEFAKVL
jgi:LPPG:FO 2-phospho-L-lactate transferase